MNTLSASAARCAGARPVAAARYGNRDDAFAAGRDHRCDRARFGTTALRVRSILDIAANVNVAIFVNDRRANVKVRVRAVRLFSDFTRGVEEFVVGHWLTRPYASDCSDALSS